MTLRPEASEQMVGQFKNLFSESTQVLETGKTATGQSYLVVRFEDYFDLLTFELARKGMMDDDALVDILRLCESNENFDECLIKESVKLK